MKILSVDDLVQKIVEEYLSQMDTEDIIEFANKHLKTKYRYLGEWKFNDMVEELEPEFTEETMEAIHGPKPLTSED